ncbi:MAG: TPM domain-containing protein [Ruminococcaceae bacterium]|nr:TPM domain-containing protein [Oscillospiraceae bacterium]
MKRIFIILTALLLISLTVIPASASTPYLNDTAGLLDNTEAANLEEKLSKLSEEYDVDILIFTLDSLGGSEPDEYANYYLDNLGYGIGDNAVLLLISMEESDWYVLGNEYGATVYNSDGISYASDRFRPELSRGNYYSAFCSFADSTVELIEMEQSGESYKAPFDLTKNLLISLVIGLVLALVITFFMKSQLKSVAQKYSATDYVKRDSLKVTNAYDLYLYSTVTKIAKPKNTSSSGSTRSGGGGKF